MPPQPLTRPQRAAAPGTDPEGPFWCAAIGSGVAAARELAPGIDALARQAALLPQCPTLTRPVVGQYLCLVKMQAADWHQLQRPALLSAIAALVQFGASIGLSCALEAMAARRLADALQRRLEQPLAALGALSADFSACRAGLAHVQDELDADCALVSQRLQADQVQALLLARQAGAIQARQRGAQQDGALEALQRQMGQLRCEQAATRAEADYLRSLLPALAPLLAALARMGSAIDAILDGAQLLAARLAQLKRELAAGRASAASTARQLAAALPHWQALAAASL